MLMFWLKWMLRCTIFKQMFLSDNTVAPPKTLFFKYAGGAAGFCRSDQWISSVRDKKKCLISSKKLPKYFTYTQMSYKNAVFSPPSKRILSV